VNLIAYPVAGLAGMALYVALYQLGVYLRRPERLPRDAYFVVSALCVAAYDAFSAGLYQSHDVAEGSWFQRGQFVASGLGVTPFMRFIEAYAGRRLPSWVRAFGWIFPVAAMIVVFERADLCLSPEPAVKRVVLPVLGEIVYYERAFGPLAQVVVLGAPYIAGGVAWAAWVLTEQGNRARARWFTFGATLFVLGLLNDMLIGAGVYVAPYVLEYTWSGILLAMGYSLSQEIVDAAMARQELEESRVRLAHAERLESLGRLAGGIAHDLNNMLTPALNYAELTRRRAKDGTRDHEYLGHVISATERAAALTKQLLAFGRKQVLEAAPVDVGATVRELFPLLARLLPERIELRTAIDESVPLVIADRAALEQVFMNLVANARDSILHDGEISIAIGTEVDASGTHFVRASVRDTGVGMDAATQRKIFEPFFTTKARGKGTGLGLSIVQGIVMQHGGTIEVESVVGVGTTFIVTFPEAPASAALEAHPAAPHRVFADHIGARILVVDDDPVVRHLMEELLVEGGYRVRSAGSGEELRALLATATKRFDLLVSDVVLEDASGLEIRDLVAAAQPGIECLFVSGHAEEVLAPRGMLEPGITLLRKPFRVDEFLDAVRRSLSVSARAVEPDDACASGERSSRPTSDVPPAAISAGPRSSS